MKITEKYFINTKLFENIKLGQVFRSENGVYWLKMVAVEGGYNAVALDDGTPMRWMFTEKVYPVEAELIIK